MNKALSLQHIDKSLPIGSLEAYIYWVNQVPLLSVEQEHELAVRFQDDGDLAAARQLVMSHLRFVVRIAKGYIGYGLQQADLIQEGNIGLMKAVKRFNPQMGVRLVSFAVHWIKAEIHEFVLRNWRIVKIATTKAQRKLFFNLRRMTKSLCSASEEEVKTVAQTLNVSPKEVRTMELRLNSPDVAFDGLDENDEDSWKDPANYLEDNSTNPALMLENANWDEDQKQSLTDAFATLDERSKDIITARWLAEEKATLHDLAKKHNLSAERIRQIEELALTKLRKKLVQH